MKKLFSTLGLLLGSVAIAAPRVEVESAAPRVLVLTIRNKDKKPYYYFSPFVDEVPYLVRFRIGGKPEETGSMSCATGADWHRLDPLKSIHIRISHPAAFEAPGAEIVPLLFSRPEQSAPLLSVAKLVVEDAMRSAPKKEANQTSEPTAPSGRGSP
jgi:hypothetical protein